MVIPNISIYVSAVQCVLRKFVFAIARSGCKTVIERISDFGNSDDDRESAKQINKR